MIVLTVVSESCYCVRTQKAVYTTVYFCFHTMDKWFPLFTGSWYLTLQDEGTTIFEISGTTLQQQRVTFQMSRILSNTTVTT
jgi:hypothetical protein